MRTAIAFVLAVGCASPMSAIKADNRRLTQTVSELRAERRAQERKLRDLQRQLDEVRGKLVMSTIGPVPSLPVEVANPTAATTPAPTPAASAAPMSRVVGVDDEGYEIVYEGDAATGRAATLDDEPPRVRSQPAGSLRRVPVAAARASRSAPRAREVPSDRSPEAANDYRAAVELVRSGQHAASIGALRAFLGKYPRHDYADNAQYWLGEAYYATKDYAHALTEFRTVIETYPRGNKVPDALLKVGYCYQALGQADKSRAVLEQVVNLYPNTEPAATAAKRLETL